MPVELSHLMQLAMRQKSELEVGNLPRPVAEYLSCHPAVVFLGCDQFYKIANGHKEIAHVEFQYLPFVISRGAYYSHPDRADCVTVYCLYPETGKLYVAGIKAAAKGGEAWVQTYHRTSPKKAAPKQGRSSLILIGRNENGHR